MSQDKDVVELVDLLLGVAKVGKKVVEKAPLQEDIAALLALVPLVGPAVEGVDKIPSELKALSAEEGAALVAQIVSGLSLDGTKAADVADKSVKAAFAVAELVKAIQA